MRELYRDICLGAGLILAAIQVWEGFKHPEKIGNVIPWMAVVVLFLVSCILYVVGALVKRKTPEDNIRDASGKYGAALSAEPGSLQLPATDITVKESDPNIYIEFQDNRGPNSSAEPGARFILVNRGTFRNANTVCLERIRLRQHWIAFPRFAYSVAPYTSADAYPQIESLDRKPADPEDFFDLLWKEYESRHIPNLHELTLDLVATYQDDRRNLFETKCELVFDPSAHAKTRAHYGQTGAIQVVTLRNHKIRKIAAAVTSVAGSTSRGSLGS